LYDCDQKAQEDIVDAGDTLKDNFLELKTQNKFDGFKI